MASTPSSSNPATGIIVQTAAWGYLPLEVAHPGVVAAIAMMRRVDGVNWDLLAEIAHLADGAANDLIIVGGAEANEILSMVRDALTMAAIQRERGRR